MVRQAERLAADVVSGPADAAAAEPRLPGAGQHRPGGRGRRGGAHRSQHHPGRRDPEPGRPGGAAGRVWMLRRAAEGTTPTVSDGAPDHPDPDCSPRHAVGTSRYARHLDWRPAGGTLVGPGPAQVWVRPGVPVVPGEPPTSLQRAALVGDSGSGVSAELDWDQWSFVNVDLDLHLLRPVQDDWLLLDARTRLAATGTGLCATTLHDRGDPAARSRRRCSSRRAPERSRPPVPHRAASRRRLGWRHGAAATRPGPGQRDGG